MDSDFNKIVADVCIVFKEITAAEAIPTREASAIIPWFKHGWRIHDFRIVIEWEFKNPDQRDWYAKPGNLNLRSMLSQSRRERLIDMHSDLRWKSEINEKKKEENLAARDRKILMPCGAKVTREQYNPHLTACFQMMGRCFA